MGVWKTLSTHVVPGLLLTLSLVCYILLSPHHGKVDETFNYVKINTRALAAAYSNIGYTQPIFDWYSVGLWGFCAGKDRLYRKALVCSYSNTSFVFTLFKSLNAVHKTSKPHQSAANIGPKALEHSLLQHLKAYQGGITWTHASFFIALTLTALVALMMILECLPLGPVQSALRWRGSAPTTIATLLCALFSITAAGTLVSSANNLHDAFNAPLAGHVPVEPRLNPLPLALIWLAAICNVLVASLRVSAAVLDRLRGETRTGKAEYTRSGTRKMKRLFLSTARGADSSVAGDEYINITAPSPEPVRGRVSSDVLYSNSRDPSPSGGALGLPAPAANAAAVVDGARARSMSAGRGSTDSQRIRASDPLWMGRTGEPLQDTGYKRSSFQEATY